MVVSLIPNSFREELQQPLRDGFGYANNTSGVIEVAFERGHSSAEISTLPFYQTIYTASMILLSAGQLRDFWNWYNGTLKNGTLPFIWNFALTDDLLITEGLFDLSNPPRQQTIRVNTDGQQGYRLSMVIYGRDTIVSTDTLPDDIRELLGDISYDDFGLLLEALNRAIPAVNTTDTGLDSLFNILSQ